MSETQGRKGPVQRLNTFNRNIYRMSIISLEIKKPKLKILNYICSRKQNIN